MKKYISTCVLALVIAIVSVQAQEPSEGYILTPDKVRIFYKIVGSGPETLVAVHGGPANSLESIRPDMEPLAKGRRVIYYDQRGNGRSDLISDGKRLGYEYQIHGHELRRKRGSMVLQLYVQLLTPRPQLAARPRRREPLPHARSRANQEVARLHASETLRSDHVCRLRSG